MTRKQKSQNEECRGNKTWLLGEFQGRWATHHQGGEWGTDERDGVRTGVSEWLTSTHPVTTSVRCVWTQVHGGVIVICSNQQVHDRCIVFGFVERWKEDIVSMINRNFTRVLMMGVFSHVCSGVLWGMRESALLDSGRSQWIIFLDGWYRWNEKRRHHGPWSSSYVMQTCVGSVCVGHTTHDPLPTPPTVLRSTSTPPQLVYNFVSYILM
jgi:hypothetical protein